MSRIGENVLRSLLKAWKAVVSPFLGNNCRFYPSCSEYLVESCCTHGLFKGSRLGICRLLRCNSLSAGGFDPVPQQRVPQERAAQARVPQENTVLQK